MMNHAQDTKYMFASPAWNLLSTSVVRSENNFVTVTFYHDNMPMMCNNYETARWNNDDAHDCSVPLGSGCHLAQIVIVLLEGLGKQQPELPLHIDGRNK
ncbi:hypothetical protein EJB05_06219, partial [Eragrostis curvula]